jgi:predicted ATP-grasp superfamily ATP-dependent carboligase
MAEATALVFPDNLAALATVRELGKAGVATRLLGHHPGPGAFSRYANYVEAPNFYEDPDAWIAFVARLAEAEAEPPVLFPTEDAALLLVEYAHERLGDRVRTPYPGPGVVPKIVDKIDLYESASEIGISISNYREIHRVEDFDSEGDETAGWLVKPSCRYVLGPQGVTTFLSMSGGSKAMAGDLRDAAARMLAAGFRVMHQETVPGPFEELVSAAVCLDRDGNLVDAYTARKHCEYPEPFGDGLVVELTPDPGIIEPSVELLRSLGYWGIADAEFKRDPRDGKFKLLDVNPRVWLWHRLGADGGATELATTAFRLALSQKAPPIARSERERRAAGLTWVSPRGAAAFLARTYRPNNHGWFLPIRLTVGAARTMLRNSRTFRDPLYLKPEAWRDLMGAARNRR